MNWWRWLSACIVAVGLANAALAQVYNSNPHGRIDFVGAETATLVRPAETMDGFAVRLTDPQGRSLPGLKVEFFPDRAIPMNEPPPGYRPPPPSETYGHFEGSNVITTDADGIARSGKFSAGSLPGHYKVAAAVWIYAHPENQAVLIAPPGLLAYFQINQVWGGSGETIPSLSLPGLLGLAGLLAALAWWKRRDFANADGRN